MYELLASAAFGFVKGLYDKRGKRDRREQGHSLGFAGPVLEEVVFRGLLNGPVGLAGFIGAHKPRSAARAADVALGGLLYGSAYRRFGLLGSIAAHVAHNVAISLGRRAR